MTTTTLEHNSMRASLCLTPANHLTLKDAAGVQVTPLSGRGWLTMEGDPRDIDLRPGMPYTIERDGLTLVNVLEPSLVELEVSHTREVRWRDWPERIWAWLRRAGEARVRARMARGNYRF